MFYYFRFKLMSFYHVLSLPITEVLLGVWIDKALGNTVKG